MAIFGTSTGGGMTLAMILRAKAEGLALPAAIAPGTPWSDLTETGDSYKTNEWIDNVLVSYSGYLSHAARLYANGRDLKDPQLSPIYGDFTGFPPAILTSGTRDLFLSLTVLTHRKLRRAGVEAEAAGVRGHVARAVQFRRLRAPRPRKRSARSPASSTSIWRNRRTLVSRASGAKRNETRDPAQKVAEHNIDAACRGL